MEILSYTLEGEKKILQEFDFTFDNGLVMPVTVNLDAGDTIDLSDPDVVKIFLSKKPSTIDASQDLPAEAITIFRTHIIAIQHRVREVTPRNAEQAVEWADTLKKLTTRNVN